MNVFRLQISFFLITALTTLPLNAGELDGKGVVCRDLSDLNFLYPHSVVFGFRFLEGSVEGDAVRGLNERVAVERFAVSDEAPYRVTASQISWWNTYELNRKTLQLKFVVEGEVMFEKQCEVFADIQSYADRLEADRIAIQKEINQAMKGNKI